MMKAIRWQAHTQSVLMLIAMLTVATLPRLLVLCVSEDNHVQVESWVETVPCAPVLIDVTRPAEQVPYESCTDYPATTNLARLSDGIDGIGVYSPVVAVTIPSLLLAVQVVPAMRPAIPRDSEWIPSKSLASIQSTVLRI